MAVQVIACVGAGAFIQQQGNGTVRCRDGVATVVEVAELSDVSGGSGTTEFFPITVDDYALVFPQIILLFTIAFGFKFLRRFILNSK